MDYTYEELRKKTVAELRDIAKTLQDESIRGYTQLHKAELLPALCKALGVEMREHHEVVGLNKSQIKAAVEQIYNVKVTAVNTINVKGKMKRLRANRGMTPAWKKAVVTLRRGDRIDFT